MIGTDCMNYQGKSIPDRRNSKGECSINKIFCPYFVLMSIWHGNLLPILQMETWFTVQSVQGLRACQFNSWQNRDGTQAYLLCTAFQVT